MAGPTLFIDNLPQNFISQDMRRLFSNQGNLAGAYVPRLQRKRMNSRFGFIEVNSRKQGDRLILEADEKTIGSQRISVRWAKYPKRYRRTMRSWQLRRRTWERGYNDDQVFNRGIWSLNIRQKWSQWVMNLFSETNWPC